MTLQTNIGTVGNYMLNGTLSVPIYSANTPPPVSGLFGQFPLGTTWFDKLTQTMYVFYGTNTWKEISNNGNGTGPFPWISVSSSQGTSSNNGYLVTSGSSAVTLYLPVTSAVGNTIYFQGVSIAEGAAPAFPGYRIGQGADQQILQNNAVGTTLGPSGSLVTTSQGAYIELVCVVANTIWDVVTINAVSFVPS